MTSKHAGAKALIMWATFHADDDAHPVLWWKERNARATMPPGGRVARVIVSEVRKKRKASK